MQPQAHPHDLAQPAARAGHKPRQVVAGDVLHHAAAAVDDRAVRQPQGDAQQEVARRAVAVGARTGQRRCERLGDGAVFHAGWVERQHLAALGQRPAQLAQRDPALDDGGQVARLVVDQNRSATPSRSSGWRR